MGSVDSVDGFSVDDFTEEHLNRVLNDDDATALIANTLSVEDQAGSCKMMEHSMAQQLSIMTK